MSWRQSSVGRITRDGLMDLHPQGKRAVVTGSSRGIGEAISHRLSVAGAVVVHGRKAEAVHDVVDAIRLHGGQATGMVADLADAAECDRVIAETVAEGPIDILVNNVGGVVSRAWNEATPEER